MSNYGDLGKTAAIVLGGGLKKIEVQGQTWYEPEEQAKARLDKAYTLFQNGDVDCIITTGKYSIAVSVDPGVTGPKTEAEVGKKYLVEKFGADQEDIAERIFYENQSVDTIGNAWFVKKLCLEPLGITSCIVVTSDYHIDRSRIIFEWILGPQYTVACAAAPSPLRGQEREQRDRFESMLIDYLKTHLVASIAAGDDEAIARFMENEHRRLLSGAGPAFVGPDVGKGAPFLSPG